MARLARVVVPGTPHHVTQRGNRGDSVFFDDADYALYKDLVAETAKKAGTVVWAYCLMPNHVHLVLVPRDGDDLRAALGEAPWLSLLERRLGRRLRPAKRGRKPKSS